VRRADGQVGAVEQPPLTYVPEPDLPYPLPNAPPPIYPEYYTTRPKDMLPGYKFPKDFLLGFATAAQQWEGAIKADGKGPSIWDWASRFPGFIADNTTSGRRHCVLGLRRDGPLTEQM
jgi:beta-glucosidase